MRVQITVPHPFLDYSSFLLYCLFIPNNCCIRTQGDVLMTYVTAVAGETFSVDQVEPTLESILIYTLVLGLYKRFHNFSDSQPSIC